MSSREQPETEPQPARQVAVRPTPKLVPFLVAGVLAALAVAVAVVLLTEPAENYTAAQSVGYMTFAFSLPGVALGALVWLLLDWISRRRTRTYDVTVTPASERSPENAPR